MRPLLSLLGHSAFVSRGAERKGCLTDVYLWLNITFNISAAFRSVAPPPGTHDTCLLLCFCCHGQGQELMILEAMKMEYAVPAPVAGKVGVVSYMVGDLVDEGSILVTLEPPPPVTPK